VYRADFCCRLFPPFKAFCLAHVVWPEPCTRLDMPQIVRCAVKRVHACSCAEGCPQCVQDTSNCSEHNERIDKRGAQIVLQAVWDAAEFGEMP